VEARNKVQHLKRAVTTYWLGELLEVLLLGEPEPQIQREGLLWEEAPAEHQSVIEMGKGGDVRAEEAMNVL
jgi:hypothetical protein